ncbi:MtrAB system histidine kinase MtrB [Ornithinicoccus halotolerans]|uniref:MtrAB system histidine kinase MtrB n=1 Tax=Ornithinicoccus halotolerans TaxID=1748220 RepID=UPI0012954BD7|nr:MtrAB system histidine kinase MtrB [Ornithinicoccus halotolerans]
MIDAAREQLRRVGLLWRSSLRARVISTTVALVLLLSALVGTLLFAQVADGLVRQAVSSATLDAAQQTQRAQEIFDALDRRDDASLNAAAFDTVNMVAPADQSTRRAVLVRGLSNDRDVIISTNASPAVEPQMVPGELRGQVDEDSGHQQVMVTRVPYADGSVVPSVVVGSRVDLPRAGAHDLYLFYPMEREQGTLDLLRGTFLVAGLVLLVGMAAMAWVAARMVTVPVGVAAEVSQQLSEGNLDERLPVRGSDDELDRLAVSFNSMADSLQTQISQLETLSRLQQRFVSDVSHELRTPLTTMRMAGEVLYASRDDFPVHLARSAELLREELDRFEDLLTELLEISRYDSGAAVLDLERTDLLAMVHSTVTGLRRLVEESGSTVTVHADSEDAYAEVDRRRVARILRNLVGNAVEHGEGNPIEIAVTGSPDGDIVAVAVRDHGMGMDPHQVQHVFERFWRADSARTRTTGGTGLGLAISQEDARVHGGWLQAWGRPGAGACFVLTLPRVAGTVVPEPPPLQSGDVRDLHLGAAVAQAEDRQAEEDTVPPTLPQEPR